MRITGGRFSGHQLKAPGGRRVRPTRDPVRESLFGQLGPDLAGIRCLDLYAGSGIVGLEALSRGASHVTFVEWRRSVVAVLQENVARLGVADQVQIVVAQVGRYLARWQATAAGQKPFDLVFMDPPYGEGLAIDTVKGVEEAGCTALGAVVVVEHEADLSLPAGQGSLRRVRTRTYGRTRLTFYRRDDEGEE